MATGLLEKVAKEKTLSEVEQNHLIDWYMKQFVEFLPSQIVKIYHDCRIIRQEFKIKKNNAYCDLVVRTRYGTRYLKFAISRKALIKNIYGHEDDVDSLEKFAICLCDEINYYLHKYNFPTAIKGENNNDFTKRAYA